MMSTLSTMRSALLALGVGLLFLTTFAHAQTSAAAANTAQAEPSLIGVWKMYRNKESVFIEFRPDGSYRAMTKQGLSEGNWTQVDKYNIATWVSEDQPRRVNGFRLHRGNLIIISEIGSYQMHKRVPHWPGEGPKQ